MLFEAKGDIYPTYNYFTVDYVGPPPAQFSATNSEEYYGYLELGTAVHLSFATKNTEPDASTSFKLYGEDGQEQVTVDGMTVYTVNDPKALHIEIGDNFYAAEHAGARYFTIVETDSTNEANQATTKAIFELLTCVPV